MANPEHLEILKQGVKVWNGWRKENPNVTPNLKDADLSNMNLAGIDFIYVNLKRADLSAANLSDGAMFRSANLFSANLKKTTLRDSFLVAADLSASDLSDADLSNASLFSANVSRAVLKRANLCGANLGIANLSHSDMSEANLELATFHLTVLGDVNLTGARGLERCSHAGPSIIDHQTISKSGGLPLIFLRGCGLPESLITYYPSLLLDPVQFYSCFISYSSKDQEVVERLHADLQAKGVRCWFAPEDLKIGDKFRDRIDESIRMYDKLLIILSENSVSSSWVNDEVEAAMEREHREAHTVLFPIKIDEAVTNTEQAWAATIRRTRHIGDFTRWKDHDSYQKAFNRLLRDLRAIEEKV